MAVWFWKEAWWDLEGCFGGRLTKFNIYPPPMVGIFNIC